METNGMRLLSHSRTLPNPAPHIWSLPGTDVAGEGFDVHLEQHKLKQVFQSQTLSFSGNAWRSPQFVLDVLGRAFPGGWLGARSCLL